MGSGSGDSPGGVQQGQRSGSELLSELFEVLLSRRRAPTEQSYTASLLAKGRESILRKLTEETLEVVLEARPGEAVDRRRLAEEIADLWFHTMVLLVECDCHIQDVLEVLAQRRR
jgi:phosphoribosyl-ATP pyrophosphohydrolase